MAGQTLENNNKRPGGSSGIDCGQHVHSAARALGNLPSEVELFSEQAAQHVEAAHVWAAAGQQRSVKAAKKHRVWAAAAQRRSAKTAITKWAQATHPHSRATETCGSAAAALTAAAAAVAACCCRPWPAAAALSRTHPAAHAAAAQGTPLVAAAAAGWWGSPSRTWRRCWVLQRCYPPPEVPPHPGPRPAAKWMGTRVRLREQGHLQGQFCRQQSRQRRLAAAAARQLTARCSRRRQRCSGSAATRLSTSARSIGLPSSQQHKLMAIASTQPPFSLRLSTLSLVATPNSTETPVQAR